jgi:hypothetical protein
MVRNGTDTQNMEIPSKEQIFRKNVISKAKRAELLAAYRKSELTQKEYSLREGIKYNTFVAWLARQRRQDAFERLVSAERGHGAEVELMPSPAVPPGRLEVILRGEIVVRGDDPEAVARLVQALRA